MLSDNSLTVVHNGDRRSVELAPDQAMPLAYLLKQTGGAPRYQEDVLLQPAQQEARLARTAQHRAAAESFHAHLQKLSTLEPRELGIVMALIDLFEFGDGHLSGGNWISAFIKSLMWNVQASGPAAALEQDPLQALSNLADDLAQFWNWMTDAADLQKRHPNLFVTAATECAPTPEPPAAAETTRTTAKQRAKAPGARKPRKKVAHA